MHVLSFRCSEESLWQMAIRTTNFTKIINLTSGGTPFLKKEKRKRKRKKKKEKGKKER